MGKKRTKASDLSEAAVVERAKSFANQWMWAVSLRHTRITSPRPQETAFHPFGLDSFNEADWQQALRLEPNMTEAAENLPNLDEQTGSE